MIPLADLIQGARRVPMWLAFASDEIQQRYRRSKLGMVWIVISYLIFVGTISLFFRNYSDMTPEQHLLYVAINFAVFRFLLSNVTDGCAVFRTSRSWIMSVALPHSIYAYKSVARSLFVFVIDLTVAMCLFFYLGNRLQPFAWEALPALALLLIDAVLVQLLLGYIATRYPDVEHFVQSITRILYFTTPVLWVRDEHTAGGLRYMVSELNPFTHALEIFSSPILGQHADQHSWLVMLYLSAGLFLLTLIVGGYANRRLSFWL